MKTCIICISLFVSFLFFSCERKSGNINNSHNIGTPRNQPYLNQPRQKPISKPIITESNNRTASMNPAEIFEKYNSAVFMVYTSDGFSNYQGSGFFISSSGIAVSNYHVFKGTAIGQEQIKLSDGSSYKIRRVIARNEDDDIIVFEVESNGNNFNYIPISNKIPRVGEKAYAIGSPRGLENTFSSGEISQLRGDTYIQISVPIDHGSSGGALINPYGEVIGITTAGLDDSGANLNFAVNINVLKKYLQ